MAGRGVVGYNREWPLIRGHSRSIRVVGEGKSRPCSTLSCSRTGEQVAWRVSLGPAAAAVAAAGTRYSRLASEADVAPLVAKAQQLLQPKKDPDEGALQGGLPAHARAATCSRQVAGFAAGRVILPQRARTGGSSSPTPTPPVCLHPPPPGRKLGRGKRTRGAASYLDIGERDFNRLVQEGVEGKAALWQHAGQCGSHRGPSAQEAAPHPPNSGASGSSCCRRAGCC